MRNRLVTSGCSFTDYCWPTWADYLACYFDDYINVGNAGSDNANISRNVIQTANAGDTVVILWSGWNRQNFWRDHLIPTPKNQDNHWDFHWVEKESRAWLTEFYNPIDRTIVSMDYIKMVDLHSRVMGYDVYHFSAFPWMTGELEKNPHPKMESILDQYDIKHNYLSQESMWEFRERQPGFCKIYDTKYNNRDEHPGPLCHYDFMNEMILPVLDITPNPLLRDLAIKHEHMVDNHISDIQVDKKEIALAQ